MDRAEREALARAALDAVRSGETDVLVIDQDRAVTRFTHNAIHQNVQYDETTVRFRTVSDGRTGCAQTNSTGDGGLRDTADRAADLAALAPHDPDYPGMQPQTVVGAAPAEAFDRATATTSPERRARIAAEIFAVAERQGLWAAGFVSNDRVGVTVANTHGLLLSFDATECAAAVKQNGEDSTGYAECFTPSIDRLDGTRLGEIAAEKALRSKAPAAVDAGTWTVIFEPAAFSELVAFLADHFSARAFDEGSSFLSDHLGERFTGENVSISDDFRNPLAPGMPFDFDGAPKAAVALLDRGTASTVVTDRYWARKLARDNTGHALPAPNPAGPQALNIVVAAGTKPVEDLVAETERGLLVSRLWYTRAVDQRKTILTGMTRDGTFLIEHGRIARGVRNLRFNQSVLGMLRDAEFSSAPAHSVSYNYSVVVPAVKVAGFRFTSLADF